MRVLILSDVHSNPAALEAIREPFDTCICLGDLVEYGPDPRPCLDWLRKANAIMVRGNHDHGVAQNVAIQGSGGFRYLTMVTRKTTAEQLTEADRRFLADLPTTRLLTLGGKRFLLVHASPRDPLDEYVQPDPKAWAAQLEGLNVDYLLVGHTHVPLTMQIGKTTILNPGSVGLQRDSDPRAKYAIFENGQIEIKAVEYDVERTIAAVESSSIEPQAKKLLTEVYRSGRLVLRNGNGNGSTPPRESGMV